MTKIQAPFTDEQVATINTFQVSRIFHPFTCCNDKAPAGKEAVMIATNAGMVCHYCDVVQDWVWDGMADKAIVDAHLDAQKKWEATCK